jgi:myosin heavy subunit
MAARTEDVSDDKKAPAKAGTQIRQSASYLVLRLSACTPHSIRCIKPNDKKSPMDFNSGYLPCLLDVCLWT